MSGLRGIGTCLGLREYKFMAAEFTQKVIYRAPENLFREDMAKALIFSCLMLLVIGFSFASECTDACQADYDRIVTNAQALHDAKQYYIGSMDSNCINEIEARAGEPNSCMIAYIGRPATGTAGCLDNCLDDACSQGCNDAFQECCLASAEASAGLWRTECLAACAPVVEDKCIDVTCFDKCEGSQEYRSGSCNHDTGLCEYGTKNNCQYGCNGDFCAEAPEPVEPTQTGCTVSTNAMFSFCKAYCQSKTPDDCSVTAASSETPGVLYSCACMCGEGPDYTYPSYSQIDCTGSAPRRMVVAQPQDNCANVRCDDKCEGSTLKTDGNCDEDTGRCAYTETPCEFGCNSSSLTCNEAAGGKFAGRLYYTEYNRPNGVISEQGTEVPLRNLKLEFIYKSEDGVEHIDKTNFVAYTDSEGKFSWDAPAEFFAAGNRIEVDAVMADANGKLYESIDQRNGGTTPDPLGWILVKDLPPTDPMLGNMEMDFKELGAGQAVSAQIYANLLRAVEFKENVLGAASTKTERATIFSATGTSHTTELNPSLSSRGMFIQSSDSLYYRAEAPVNREYHEYCHHIQDETWGQDSLVMPPGRDHQGYPANKQSTGWGYSEGWAEFCAMEMVRHINNVQNVKYVTENVMQNLEFDYIIRGPLKSDEEYAIAGIMLDLADSAADYTYGRDDDSVSLPLTTVWAAVSTARDFGDGKGMRKPLTLHDFYVAVSDEVDSASMQPEIDAIFVSHGAYQDENKNGKWDAGEAIGYTGEGSAASDMRPDVRPDEGTQVAVSGGEGLLADINVMVSGPMSYLSYSYRAPVLDGKVYLPTVPSQYPSTITVTAVDGSTGTPSGKTFSITNSELYQNIDPSRAIGNYDPGLTASAAACSSDGQCLAWNRGDACQSGSCVYSTATGLGESGQAGSNAGTGSSSNAGCCGPSFILLMVLGWAAFAGRRGVWEC